MKILYLTLKSKWWDMIAAGEKLEEYREINSYWITRLLSDFSWDVNEYPIKINEHKQVLNKGSYKLKDFDIVHFARGGNFHPKIPQMQLEIKGISTGTGNPAWGAELGKEYFVIKLGDLVNNK